MKTIEALFDNDTIDMVYVHFVDEDMDQMFDCYEPVEKINLERIMKKGSPSVVRSRLHHHHRIAYQGKIDGVERKYLQAGWRREYLSNICYKMIREISHEVSFLTKR